jgi:lactate dehydrogenase-like 2-hydroxyacid dehydrogenase
MKRHLVVERVASQLTEMSPKKFFNSTSRLLESPQKTNIHIEKVLLVGHPDFVVKRWNIKPEDLSDLRKLAKIDVELTSSITEEKLAQKCDGYDYLMINLDCLPFAGPNTTNKLTETFYKHPAIQSLKIINSDMTDADFLNPVVADEVGILLQTSPVATTRSVAESTVCEILLHAKRRHLAYVENIMDAKGLNLYGKTAGIVGMGHIGTTVANILHGMGMKIIYNDIKDKSLVVPTFRNNFVSLPTLFKKSQVISIHIPSIQPTNDSNEGLINYELLKNCNQAILINHATDIIVDVPSVAKAIRSGNLSGYSVEARGKITQSLKSLKQVHFSPSCFDSDESRLYIKETWIQNTLSALQGSPQNIW